MTHAHAPHPLTTDCVRKNQRNKKKNGKKKHGILTTAISSCTVDRGGGSRGKRRRVPPMREGRASPEAFTPPADATCIASVRAATLVPWSSRRGWRAVSPPDAPPRRPSSSAVAAAPRRRPIRVITAAALLGADLIESLQELAQVSQVF